MLRICAAAVFLAAGIACGDDLEARERIAGTWESSESGDAKAAWVLEEDGEKLRVTYEEGARKLLEYSCTTTGEECSVKLGRKEVKVSMWFSGPKLVLLETAGNNVVKREFEVVEDGNVLTVEFMPVVPPGETAAARFGRIEPQPQ